MIAERAKRFPRGARGVSLLLIACWLPGTAAAQSWKPDKPVELIAASGAGGNTDLLARTVHVANRGDAAALHGEVAARRGRAEAV